MALVLSVAHCHTIAALLAVQCTVDSHTQVGPSQTIATLGDCMKIDCMACIGGTRRADDMRRLASGVHCVVGTTGRVFDMINCRALQANEIRLFVLDDADEMLSRGFKDQIYDIFRLLPAERQVG
jgi:translation initiation factor 4A